MTKVNEITHPEYDLLIDLWRKWRLTYRGGRDFVDEYLEKLSVREDTTDFKNRKAISYCPAFAKASLNDIKNAIFQRTCDITRGGGPDSYTKAIEGLDGGVDFRGSTMGSYVGRKILPELLMQGKVGVFVDMPVDVGVTQVDRVGKHPYIYTYEAENIRSWAFDEPGQPNHFSHLLLRDTVFTRDTETDLPSGTTEDQYRFLWRAEDGIHLQFYNFEGDPVGDEILLQGWNRIPFVLFEIPTSLLEDVADYQIALLNLESSDVSYSLKSNYPFYTEQYDSRYEMPYSQGAANEGAEGESGENIGKTTEVATGGATGRRYPKGLERPDFIHPSSEPLKASMEKGTKLKEDIRMLINLAVTNLNPKLASAESKSHDKEGLEAGLSFIGLVLENGERTIAEHWARYEGPRVKPATIKYPKSYSLKTDEDRRREADKLQELIVTVASDTHRRETAKRILTVLHGPHVTHETLMKMHEEVDAAPAIISDPKIIHSDLEAGLVGEETASELRGYKEDEIEKARADHAARLARISKAQGGEEGDARGTPDSQINQPSSAQEKAGKDQRGESKL